MNTILSLLFAAQITAYIPPLDFTLTNVISYGKCPESSDGMCNLIQYMDGNGKIQKFHAWVVPVVLTTNESPHVENEILITNSSPAIDWRTWEDLYLTNHVNNATNWGWSDFPYLLHGEMTEIGWSTPTNWTVTVTNSYSSNYIHHARCWLEWKEIDGQADMTRPTISFVDPGLVCITNYGNYYITNSIMFLAENGWQWNQPGCKKEHLDRMPQTETTYTQRNLMLYVTFDGMTNSQCVLSSCIATNTRTWHWDKQKVYDK